MKWVTKFGFALPGLALGLLGSAVSLAKEPIEASLLPVVLDSRSVFLFSDSPGEFRVYFATAETWEVARQNLAPLFGATPAEVDLRAGFVSRSGRPNITEMVGFSPRNFREVSKLFPPVLQVLNTAHKPLGINCFSIARLFSAPGETDFRFVSPDEFAFLLRDDYDTRIGAPKLFDVITFSYVTDQGKLQAFHSGVYLGKSPAGDDLVLHTPNKGEASPVVIQTLDDVTRNVLRDMPNPDRLKTTVAFQKPRKVKTLSEIRASLTPLTSRYHELIGHYSEWLSGFQALSTEQFREQTLSRLTVKNLTDLLEKARSLREANPKDAPFWKISLALESRYAQYLLLTDSHRHSPSGEATTPDYSRSYEITNRTLLEMYYWFRSGGLTEPEALLGAVSAAQELGASDLEGLRPEAYVAVLKRAKDHAHRAFNTTLQLADLLEEKALILRDDIVYLMEEADAELELRRKLSDAVRQPGSISKSERTKLISELLKRVGLSGSAEVAFGEGRPLPAEEVEAVVGVLSEANKIVASAVEGFEVHNRAHLPLIQDFGGQTFENLTAKDRDLLRRYMDVQFRADPMDFLHADRHPTLFDESLTLRFASEIMATFHLEGDQDLYFFVRSEVARGQRWARQREMRQSRERAISVPDDFEARAYSELTVAEALRVLNQIREEYRKDPALFWNWLLTNPAELGTWANQLHLKFHFADSPWAEDRAKMTFFNRIFETLRTEVAKADMDALRNLDFETYGKALQVDPKRKDAIFYTLRAQALRKIDHLLASDRANQETYSELRRALKISPKDALGKDHIIARALHTSAMNIGNPSSNLRRLIHAEAKAIVSQQKLAQDLFLRIYTGLEEVSADLESEESKDPSRRITLDEVGIREFMIGLFRGVKRVLEAQKKFQTLDPSVDLPSIFDVLDRATDVLRKELDGLNARPENHPDVRSRATQVLRRMYEEDIKAWKALDEAKLTVLGWGLEDAAPERYAAIVKEFAGGTITAGTVFGLELLRDALDQRARLFNRLFGDIAMVRATLKTQTVSDPANATDDYEAMSRRISEEILRSIGLLEEARDGAFDLIAHYEGKPIPRVDGLPDLSSSRRPQVRETRTKMDRPIGADRELGRDPRRNWRRNPSDRDAKDRKDRKP